MKKFTFHIYQDISFRIQIHQSYVYYPYSEESHLMIFIILYYREKKAKFIKLTN